MNHRETAVEVLAPIVDVDGRRYLKAGDRVNMPFQAATVLAQERAVRLID
jgi:hypothetical protein